MVLSIILRADTVLFFGLLAAIGLGTIGFWAIYYNRKKRNARLLEEEDRKWRREQFQKKEAERQTRELMRQSVASNSERYRYLKYLSEQIQSYPLDREYRYTVEMPSKAQVDRASSKKVMMQVISDRPDLLNIIKQAYDNEKTARLFDAELNKLPPYSERSPDDRHAAMYYATEREMTKTVEDLIRPVVPEFHLVFHYVSPAGRSSYEREAVFSVHEMIDLLKEMKRAAESRTAAQVQRNLVSDSLRYDVMKRDGFRCVLCGRDASDGVKLHVDHIIPVSKGGLSTMENLRTLCEDCNRGKRDKYDEQGVN